MKAHKALLSSFAPIIFPFIVVAFFSGCKPPPPESHRIADSGIERGVEIEVMLANGGTATLVCPLYPNTQPRGAHGIECYLRSYSKTK